MGCHRDNNCKQPEGSPSSSVRSVVCDLPKKLLVSAEEIDLVDAYLSTMLSELFGRERLND